MQLDKVNTLEGIIKKLEKAKEYLGYSTQAGDDMEMLALGYMEKSYQELFDLKDEITDTED